MTLIGRRATFSTFPSNGDVTNGASQPWADMLIEIRDLRATAYQDAEPNQFGFYHWIVNVEWDYKLTYADISAFQTQVNEPFYVHLRRTSNLVRIYFPNGGFYDGSSLGAVGDVVDASGDDAESAVSEAKSKLRDLGYIGDAAPAKTGTAGFSVSFRGESVETIHDGRVTFADGVYVSELTVVSVEDVYDDDEGGDNGGGEDGEPPETTPTPKPVTPASGGCKASLDGPSGCNWTVPPDGFPPDPDGFPEMPMPGDDFSVPDGFGPPGFPIEKIRMPDMPPIPCRMPDFGNSGPCAPLPGMGGSLPGGWDAGGNIGGSTRGGGGGGVSVRTKGPTKDAREKKTFEKRTCFPAGSSYMATITQLLTEAGISPLNIVFEITAEWDKQLPAQKCFAKGVRRWDAAAWFAEKLMCILIDEGDGNVYIGPPFVRPGQKTHVFDEMVDLFAMDRVSDSQEAYYAVEVYRLESRMRGRRVSDFSKVAFVEPPFSVDPSSVLRIQVGPDYTESEAANLAALRAGRIRQSTAGIQVSVPYSEDYFLRDEMLIRAPVRRVQEKYIIYGKESSLSLEGNISILTGILPATAAILNQTPDLIEAA